MHAALRAEHGGKKIDEEFSNYYSAGSEAAPFLLTAPTRIDTKGQARVRLPVDAETSSV